MSAINVKNYFKKYHMEDRIIELKDSSSTVSLAAKALKCEEQQIAKTLSFLLNGKPILIVTSGDAKVDNIKYKKEFQERLINLLLII